jgi:23S rRNA pseudouridine2457 synthase
LLLLSDEPGLNTRLLDPKNNHPRTYWAQVDGEIDEPALQKLRAGVVIEGHITLPANARRITPVLSPRAPPIRFRIGRFNLPSDLAPGQWRELSERGRLEVFS